MTRIAGRFLGVGLAGFLLLQGLSTWLLPSAAAQQMSPYTDKAMRADERGDFEGAIKWFRRHVEEFPDDATGHNNLGVAVMRYGIEKMMSRQRIEGRKLFLESAGHYRNALQMDRNNNMAAENLRGVLHAIESNFKIKPDQEDLDLLESLGLQYDTFQVREQDLQNDPVHKKIRTKLGVGERPPPSMARGEAGEGEGEGDDMGPMDGEGDDEDGSRHDEDSSSGDAESDGPDPFADDTPPPMPPKRAARPGSKYTMDAMVAQDGEEEPVAARTNSRGDESSDETGSRKRGSPPSLPASASSSKPRRAAPRDDMDAGADEAGSGDSAGDAEASGDDGAAASGGRPSAALIARIRAIKNPYIRATRLFDAGAVPEAIRDLCSQERFIIKPSASELQSGKPQFKTISRASAALKVCGVTMITGVVSSATMAEVKTRVESLMKERMATVSVEADGRATFETVDIAKRSKSRYEFFNPLESPFTNDEVAQNSFVLPVVRRALGKRIELDTFSTVMSLPGAPTQHWHQDAGALFPRTGLHLPAHGVVAFLAVDNVTRDMGPTEFVAGTHVGCAPGEDPQPAAIGDGTSIDVCSAAKVDKLLYGEGAQGSVILFDFRIMHRGGPNSSKTPRPLLYSTYLREWYYDKVNFMQSYTRKFDALTPQQKKLFNRLDHKRYVKSLEDKLRELGFNPSAIESEYKYDSYSYGEDPHMTRPADADDQA